MGVAPATLRAVATPHDSLVKRVFSVRENAIGELRSVLPPEVLEHLDLDRLEVQERTFVDVDLVQRHSDQLYSVPIDGELGFVYVLFEHQSSDDALMAFRLLAYMIRIWEAYLREHPGVRRLPCIIPLVLHHAEIGWQSATSFQDLFAAELIREPVWASLIPSFRFLLDDICGTSDEELQARQMSAFALGPLGPAGCSLRPARAEHIGLV